MFVLVRAMCPHCRSFEKAIMQVNRELPRDNQIQIIDCRFWEEYNVKLEPLMEKLEDAGLSEGYPFCFLVTDEENLNGIVLEPAEPNILKSYLLSLLQDKINH